MDMNVIVAAGLAGAVALGVAVTRRRRVRASASAGPARPRAPVTAPAAQAGSAIDVAPAEALQTGLHALALVRRSGCAAADDPRSDDTLHAAVVAALEQRDWSARQLPRRPQLLPQLIQTVNDNVASARAMAAIIGQDPVLTGNLLRIANSPVYRLQAKPVDSLQRAVTLVGTEGIRQIISAVLVQPVMQVHCEAFPQFGSVIWEHALLASRAAADHARLVTLRRRVRCAMAGADPGPGRGVGDATAAGRLRRAGRCAAIARAGPAVAGCLVTCRWPGASRPPGNCRERCIYALPRRPGTAPGVGRPACASASGRCGGQPAGRHGRIGQAAGAGPPGAAAGSAAARAAVDLAAPAWARGGNAGHRRGGA